MEHEITRDGTLLDERGRVREPGWARAPRLVFEPARAPRLRLKEWDFFAVTTADHYVAVSVASLGYLGVVFVQWIDVAAGRAVADRFVATPLARGVTLPPRDGDVRFTARGVDVAFAKDGDGRRLTVEWRRGGPPLEAEITLGERPGIVVATPIGERGFYYNHKAPRLPARGQIRCGARQLSLDGAFGTMDWGRGVWAYDTFWNWATASGRLDDGRVFGLNLGRGFGDLSTHSENALFLDEQLVKLGEVRFEYGAPRQPWRFRDDAGRIDLTLAPRHLQHKRLNLLVLRSELNQAIGRYQGFIRDDAGRRISVAGVVGWAEEMRARW